MGSRNGDTGLRGEKHRDTGPQDNRCQRCRIGEEAIGNQPFTIEGSDQALGEKIGANGTGERGYGDPPQRYPVLGGATAVQQIAPVHVGNANTRSQNQPFDFHVIFGIVDSVNIVVGAYIWTPILRNYCETRNYIGIYELDDICEIIGRLYPAILFAYSYKGTILNEPISNNGKTAGLGLDLQPGDEHYRAFVGPPKDYDLVSAMVFNLLTCLGLRQHNRVLDIGCGSLRVGRLLIPYLNPRNYFGIEPNRWLVEDGIENEIGRDLINIKEPTFSFHASADEFKNSLNVDFAVAQSIFSHCDKDTIKEWLSQVSYHLNDKGALVATFVVGNNDFEGRGWIYPGCVCYKPETLAEMASEFELSFGMLNWAHPRQNWAIFAKKNYDRSLVVDGPISWNRFLAKAMRE